MLADHFISTVVHHCCNWQASDMPLIETAAVASLDMQGKFLNWHHLRGDKFAAEIFIAGEAAAGNCIENTFSNEAIAI